MSRKTCDGKQPPLLFVGKEIDEFLEESRRFGAVGGFVEITFFRVGQGHGGMEGWIVLELAVVAVDAAAYGATYPV